MARFSSIKDKVSGITADFKRRDLKAVATDYGKRISYPEFIRKRIEPKGEITRASQWTALVLLPLLIILSFAVVEAAVDIFASILGEFTGAQQGIFQFLVTLIALGLFSLTAYLWFLWVRTGGFGMLRF